MRDIDIEFSKICTVAERSPTRGALSLSQSIDSKDSLHSSELLGKIYITNNRLKSAKKELHQQESSPSRTLHIDFKLESSLLAQ
jgi:hypothetical protein